MKKRYPLLLPILAMLLIVSACNRAPRLIAYPQGSVPGLSFLDFEFSANMVPAEEVEKWQDKPYLNFSPPIEGMYQWKDRRTLRFQARHSLPLATEYTVTSTSELPSMAPIDFPKLNFNTEPFRVKTAEVSWRDESYYGSSEAPMQAVLRFNTEIERDTLEKRMTIYANDKLLSNYYINSWTASDEHEITFELVDGIEGPIDFRFEFKAGLIPTEGKMALSADTAVLASVQPIKDLVVNNIEVNSGSGSSRSIEISFNQPVKAKELEKAFKVVPEVAVLFRQHGSRITIEGDFVGGRTYGFRLEKGLKGMGGGTLGANWGSSMTMPSLKPFARFTDFEGMYMLKNGLENLRISSSNKDTVELKVYEIYENNLVHFLDDNYSLAGESWYSSQDEYFDGWGRGASISDWGREIYSEKIKLDAPGNAEVSTTVVHLKKKLRSKYKGIFVVEITNPGEYYADDAKIISLSDMGIVARRFGNEMLVFVNSLSTAMPISGATVNLISETNQTMFSIATDGAGVARFSNIEALGPGFDERLVYVTHGGDYNFLDLDNTRIETGRFELEGKTYREWDAYAWSDRNLYRPGDTAHVACLLRDWDYQVKDGMPVTAKLYGPSGEEGEMMRFTTQKGGAISFDLPLSMGSRTGTYALDFYTFGDNNIATLQFHVEDFIPDKIKVSPRAAKPEYQRGDTAQLIVDAEYYFGAPCDSHLYETRFAMSLGAYHSRKYKDFEFHFPRNSDLSTIESNGVLNEQGRDTVPLPIPLTWEYFGPIYAAGYATVHDNTGRTVTRKAPFVIHTQSHYLGLRKANEYYLSMGDAAEFDVVAVSPKADTPADSFPLAIKVTKQIWHNTVRHTSEKYVMESENTGQTIFSDTLLQLGKPLHFAYKLKDPGVYRISIGRLGEQAEHLIEYLVYGKGAEYASTFSTNREGTVHIRADKDSYKVGETARVHFATPFAGRMIVTLERDKVIRHMYVDVPRNSTEISIPITDAMVPNVVVNTTLFHPVRGKTPLPFTVSHGYKSLKVDNSSHDLPVKVTLPERSFPGIRTFATVRTAPNAQLVVAAVDEGILAIKNFQTPDPYPYFYAAREHRVESFDMYRFLLPEILKPGPSTGGDMSGGYSGLNPFQIRRFRPVAIWSGIVKADAGGVAKIPLDIQAGFNGKVRVMAVAWQGRRFGSGDAFLKVHDDLVVQAGIPRLITDGDSVHIPVHVMNTTDKVMEAILRLKLEGPLASVGQTEYSVKVMAHDTYKGGFDIRANGGLGASKIKLSLQQGKQNTVSETVLAVRAGGHLEKSGGHGSLNAGEQRSIVFPAGFHPETQRFTLRASNFPAMEHTQHLRDLILYPHGCTEQIVSKLFPQLYFKDLVEVVAPDAFENTNPVKNVNEGIRTILERQAYNGGFGYWSPEADSDWLTVYTMHFLLEAQKLGFPIHEDAMKRGMERVHVIAQSDGLYDYTFSWGGNSQSKRIAPKERTYALYVCAMAGQPEIPLLNYFKSHPDELSGDGTFLIAAAFALAKDQASFLSMLPPTWHPETTERVHDGNLDSELRPSAIMLNALLSADPGHPFVDNIVQYLARNADKAYSTQDKAWLFLGLGKAAKGQAADQLKIELWQGGKLLQAADGNGFVHIDRSLAGQTVNLKVGGSGRAYYAWEAEGVPLGANTKPRRANNGLKISREFFTTGGDRIIRPYFLQGELVVCQIKVSAERALENLAITDLIAAGMEVENQRLSATDYPWITTPTTTLEAQDVRDGGIVTYTSVPKGKTQVFSYLLRPVNPGRFQVPPIVVDAMYDTRLYGYDQGFQAWILPATAQLPARTQARRQTALASNEPDRLMTWWHSNLERARQ